MSNEPNTGGWISKSYSIRATAVEVLQQPDEDDIILYFLGLNVVVTIPGDEARRVAQDILTSSGRVDPTIHPVPDTGTARSDEVVT